MKVKNRLATLDAALNVSRVWVRMVNGAPMFIKVSRHTNRNGKISDRAVAYFQVPYKIPITEKGIVCPGWESFKKRINSGSVIVMAIPIRNSHIPMMIDGAIEFSFEDTISRLHDYPIASEEGRRTYGRDTPVNIYKFVGLALPGISIGGKMKTMPSMLTKVESISNGRLQNTRRIVINTPSYYGVSLAKRDDEWQAGGYSPQNIAPEVEESFDELFIDFDEALAIPVGHGGHRNDELAALFNEEVDLRNLLSDGRYSGTSRELLNYRAWEALSNTSPTGAVHYKDTGNIDRMTTRLSWSLMSYAEKSRRRLTSECDNDWTIGGREL